MPANQGSRCIFRRLTAVAGWQPLSARACVVNCDFQAVTTAVTTIRFNGVGSTLLTNSVFRLRNVDLSKVEIAGSGDFIVIASTV